MNKKVLLVDKILLIEKIWLVEWLLEKCLLLEWIILNALYTTNVLGPKFYTKKCVNHDTAKFTMNQNATLLTKFHQ